MASSPKFLVGDAIRGGCSDCVGIVTGVNDVEIRYTYQPCSYHMPLALGHWVPEQEYAFPANEADRVVHLDDDFTRWVREVRSGASS